MSNEIEHGGPAFPVTQQYDHEGLRCNESGDGMTLRQYAAIKLRVPNSGTDWLDDMIRENLRDEFAAKAMAVVWADIPEDATRGAALLYLGECSYEMADAMIAARSKA